MLDRQLGIIYILMKKNIVTASELAERYEVSVRTIYRDIEALSMAGFPVFARKGKNGGISLTENFVLNKLLVTEEEQHQILAALQSLEEVGAQPEQNTLQKLGDFFKTDFPRWVAVDFSDWSGGRRQLFEDIRRAVLERRVITFDYYGQYGEMTHRTAEPVQLLFKEYTWYLRAFCRERQAMRLFKLLRMKRVAILDEKFRMPDSQVCFQPEAKKLNPVCKAGQKSDSVEITLRIASTEAYRIYDRFEEEEITVLSDGDFLVCTKYPPDDWAYGLILSFGPAAEVLAPLEMREEVRRRLTKMLEKYQ